MIAPTRSLEEAGRQTWDALVVGAGPAGALAARELARQGCSVLLVERAQFPRYKVCGGCLNPRSLGILRQAGLGSLMSRLGAVPIHALCLGAPGTRARVRLPGGMGISREAFDDALARAAIEAGSQFLPGTTATLRTDDTSTGQRQVRLRQPGHETIATARIVLGCGGLGGRIEENAEDPTWNADSRIGAGAMIPAAPLHYQPGTIYMACAPEGYIGQVVVEDGRIDAAAALDPVAVKQAGGIGPLLEQILERAGFPGHPGLAELPWKGTPHLTRRAPRLGGRRVFTLGDAAGYIEPFTGEGMAWALAGAAAVAPLALHAIRQDWDDRLLRRWEATFRREVTRRQGVCRLTARLLRGTFSTRLLVRSLDLAPWIARPFLSFMYRT